MALLVFMQRPRGGLVLRAFDGRPVQAILFWLEPAVNFRRVRFLGHNMRRVICSGYKY